MAIFINLIFLGGCILFCDIKYEVSDDFVMSTILSGAYTKEPNPYIMFVNVLWGYCLLPLYGLFPEISWYLIVQLALCFCAFTAITYLLFCRENTVWALLLSCLFLSFFSDDAYLLVQFTKTAALLTMAGGLLFLSGLLGEKRNIAMCLAGSALFLIGSLYRFSCTLLVIPYLFLIFTMKVSSTLGSIDSGMPTALGLLSFMVAHSPVGAWRFTVNVTYLLQRTACHTAALKKIAKCAGLCFLLFLGAVFLKAVNDMLYLADDGYRYYRAYATARSKIVDYPNYDYCNNEDEFKSLGMTENDFLMLKTWNFADNDFFTLDKVQAVAEILKEYRKTHCPGIRQALAALGERQLFRYTVAWGCIALMALILGTNRKNWWIPVLPMILSFAILLYFAIQGRLVYRVEYCIFLAAFLCILECFRSPIGHKRLAAGGLVLILLLKLPLYLPDTAWKTLPDSEYQPYINDVFFYSWNFDRRKYRRCISRRQVQPDLMQEMEAHPENFYFMDFNTTIQTLYYDFHPFHSVRRGYYENKLYLSGVTANHPDINSVLSESGMQNPMRALAGENVYLIDNDTWLIKLTYLREHYYPDAQITLWKEKNGYKIWKITAASGLP